MMTHMRPASIAIVIVAAMLLFPSVSPASGSGGARDGIALAKPVGANYVPGQVLVKFKSGVSAQGRRLAEVDAGVGATVRTIDLGGETVQLLNLDPDVSVEKAVCEFEASGLVEYAEPNYWRQVQYTPSDPGFPNQWGLNNTGQTYKGIKGKPGADIDACRAWDTEKGTTNPVKVAVVDSGVDLKHPDLSGRTAPGGYNYAGISTSAYNWSLWLGNSADTCNWAQSFRGSGQNVTHVGLFLSKHGTPLGQIHVDVRTSLDAGTSSSTFDITPSEVGTSAATIYKKLNQPIFVPYGATYYIVVRISGVWSDPANYYKMGANNKTNSYDAYTDGHVYRKSGSVWISSPDYDLAFQTNPNGKPRDDNGHGTHVTGIIAANAGNGRGGAGISFGAKFIPIKAGDSSGFTSTSNVALSIRRAVDYGADLINISIAGDKVSRTERDAVNYAYRHGVTIFAGAGNTGNSQMMYPAGHEHVIGVGATDMRDQKASFSTFNSSVDLCAPGRFNYSTTPTYKVPLNLKHPGWFNKNYGYMSGTSTATPHATGVGALLKSRCPSLQPDDIARMLERTAEDLGQNGRDDYYGYGRVNAAEALNSGPQTTWYLAEGSTAWGYSCYVSIENPNTTAVNCDITYMTEAGPVSGGSVNLPAKSQATVNPADKLGNIDFSTQVVCREGKTIAVDRNMTWTGQGASSPESHSSIGVTSPQKTWYLPEGSSSWGFECWLLIQNPNSSEATCTVTYMIEGQGPKTVEHKVPANSRKTYSLASDLGGAYDVSIKVSSSVPVIPERAMYRNNRREGHDSIGTTSPALDYYLAEGTTAWGFTTYVLIQNPNDKESRVTVTYMTPTGAKPQAPFTMSANSRKTIRVNDVLSGTDLSTQVSGTLPLIAERAMYWDNGTGEATHDSIGMASPHTTFYLPDGETSNGRETWTLVQNPNGSPVKVEISYLTPTGTGNKSFTDTIAANSRKTYSMADEGISGRASVMVRSLTSGKKIMVERAMYWNNRGAGTDTIGGYSD